MDSVEQKLIKRCVAGDEKAWETVYAMYAGKVKAYIRAFMFSSSEVEDLCQEIFVELFKAMPFFKGESSLKTFLLSLSKNKCISFLRKKTALKRAKEDKNISIYDNTDILRTEERSLDEKVIKKEESEQVINLITTLSEDCKRIIRFRFFLGLSYAHICQEMTIPLGTLCSKLKRCLMAMRKNYERGTVV